MDFPPFRQQLLLDDVTSLDRFKMKDSNIRTKMPVFFLIKCSLTKITLVLLFFLPDPRLNRLFADSLVNVVHLGCSYEMSTIIFMDRSAVSCCKLTKICAQMFSHNLAEDVVLDVQVKKCSNFLNKCGFCDVSFISNPKITGEKSLFSM